MPCDYEVIYVNDGSRDSTMACLEDLRSKDDKIRIVDLSRNFGKEVAMSAGFDHTQGDAVIVIDTDLQDPPEIIPELYSGWEEGFDVVYAQRATRDGETRFKKLTASIFYRVIGQLSHVEIPKDTGDFRLLSRRAVDSLGQLREQHRFMKGLFSWIGYPQKAVIYKRDKRFAGDTKWNYWKLWNLGLEGVFSFSTLPLRIWTYLGSACALFSMVYLLFIFVRTLMYGADVPGYPSLISVVLFFSACAKDDVAVVV